MSAVYVDPPARPMERRHFLLFYFFSPCFFRYHFFNSLCQVYVEGPEITRHVRGPVKEVVRRVRVQGPPSGTLPFLFLSCFSRVPVF